MDILWFRSDLRVIDNPALQYARELGVGKAVYFITPKQWRQHHMAAIKVDFILRHVSLLKAQLADIDIELKVVEVDDYRTQVDYLRTWQNHLAKKAQQLHLIVNQELEINEVRRDEKIREAGISLTLFEADVIVPKGKLLTQQGQMYKVFTPFKRAWLQYVRDIGWPFSSQSAEGIDNKLRASLATFQCDYPVQNSSSWPLANEVQVKVIPAFLSDKIDDYQTLRDFPAIKATSGLSPYLAIGAISPRYLLTLLIHKDVDLLSVQQGGIFTWLNELIWREFYRHLLHHFPKLCMGHNFQDKYNHLAWRDDPTALRAWQQGKTGYPLVDAAMRQLNSTGWMHNRLRMVVASFLSKHLLIDWRLGEQYFAHRLIDWDLAANNGGWQWAASTGCDAQPYFRIFNPISQSEKFDPEGTFIRKYLPELASVPDKYIHFPHEYIKQHQLDCYWPVIVDHKFARQRALDVFKQAS